MARASRRSARSSSTGASGSSGTLEQLLASREIVVTCGSGGVGKTTTAAAAAAMAAAQLGGKVLVLTVDPARRLATALGLEQFGNVETRVPDELFVAAGVEPRGELWAAMLDTKQSWDDLIETHAPDAETRDAILANPLYQNIAGKFVQSHDYIAMERLYEIHSSGRYDLIVVDTPPTRNALDFLEAPERMADFFSSRLLRWLIAPYRSRLYNAASRPFYSVADRMLGSQFLGDIAEFFILFQTMYDGFVERAEAVTRTLADRRTTFVVVTTLEPAPVREADFFIDALDERGFDLGAVVLNKVLPGVPARSGGHGRGPGRGRGSRGAGRDRGRIQSGQADRCRPGVAGAARGGGELPQLPGDRHSRGRAARRAVTQARVGGQRPLLRHRHPRPGWVAASGRADLALRHGRGSGDDSRRRPARMRGWPASPSSPGSTPRLDATEVDHLQRLVASWGLLADLCFADLLLFVAADPAAEPETAQPERLVVLGQMRPLTNQTLYRSDLVGTVVSAEDRPLVARSLVLGEIIDGEVTSQALKERVRALCIPVRHRGRTIAVVNRESAPSVRHPGELERTYVEVFNRFARMIAAGEFPFASEEGLIEEAPRVGDGVILLDDASRVEYASPNAVSALHRIGVHANTEGMRLGELGLAETVVRTAFSMAVPDTEEIERGPQVTVLLRCIPLVEHQRVTGGVVLLRDISELRRRDRLLRVQGRHHP